MIRSIISIEEFIQETKDVQLYYKYNPSQVNISPFMNRPFVEYLISVSDIIKLEELAGLQRQATEKDKDFIVSQIDDSSVAGMRVNHIPIQDFNEYDKWEGGYIEGFLRTMTPVDYFIWTYAKMDKLEGILNKFKDSLFY